MNASTIFLPVGTLLRGDDFRIESVLGQGAFGVTYRAFDETLHRVAAIKEFFPRGSSREGARVFPSSSLEEFQNAKAQFLHEARALARFQHPHIVNVYGVFEENQTAYMVMEFVNGQTLSQLIEAGGALIESEALPIIEQIGAALNMMHAAQMLHGDVTPDNIMVEAREESTRTASTRNTNIRAVLLDFGLSKKIEDASGYGTVRLDAWSRFGTPGYAAIEQYTRGSQTGTFSDVYALAATLYFLLTGQAPPNAADRATGTPLPDVRALNPDASTHVALVLERALRMPPHERPQTVAEFLELLRLGSLHAGDQTVRSQGAAVTTQGQQTHIPAQVTPGEQATPSHISPPDSTTPSTGVPPIPASGDPFAPRDPHRAPGPFRAPRRHGGARRDASHPRDAYDEWFGNTRGAGGMLPAGFGCSSIGCSLGCFLFIAFILMIIASMISILGNVIFVF